MAKSLGLSERRLAAMLVLAAGLSFVARAVEAAEAIEITGQTVDDAPSPTPVSGAVITCKTARARGLPVPSGLDGQFQASLGDAEASHVHCDVSSPGFDGRTIVAEVSARAARLGVITLHRAKRVRASDLQMATTADDRHQLLDFLLASDAPREVTISTLLVEAALHAGKHCLDYAPALVVTISDAIELRKDAATGSALIEQPGKALDQLRVEGRLEHLPCDHQRLSLRVPLLMRLAPRETIKLRVRLPTTMRTTGSTQTERISLKDWNTVVVKLESSDPLGVAQVLARQDPGRR